MSLIGENDQTKEPLLLDFYQSGSFKRQPHKMVKHFQTIRRLLPTNCLGVFDHFMELAFKGFSTYWWSKHIDDIII